MNAQKIKDAYIIANKICKIAKLHKATARDVSVELEALQSLPKYSAFSEVVEADTIKHQKCVQAYFMLEKLCIEHLVNCPELLIDEPADDMLAN